MGYLFKCSFVLLTLFCSITRADEPRWSEDYGQPPIEVNPNIFDGEYEYQWLYELLISQDQRSNKPDEAFKSFRVHLRDTYEHFPHPDLIRSQHLKPPQVINGKMTYVGFFRKKYRYHAVSSAGADRTLRVRVHFSDATEQDLEQLKSKFQQAQELWNTQRPSMDFAYRFEFVVSESESDADFKVQLMDDTRGPYDQFWSRRWNHYVVAHELGHMMGLGDEYETLTGKSDCLAESLMCASWSGDRMPHHYYFILRRLIQPEPKLVTLSK